MFAEVRREPPDGRRRAGEPNRKTGQPDLALGGMIHLLEKIDRLQVRIIDQVFDRIDRASGNVDAVQNVEPFPVAARDELVRQEAADVLRKAADLAARVQA